MTALESAKEITLECLYTQLPPPGYGLVAYYPFNGNANDESGSGAANNGSVFEAILTTDRFGKDNSSYSFDGNNDYIEIAPSEYFNTATMDNISISIWFNLINYNGFNRLITFMNKTVNVILDFSISTSVAINPQPENYNQVFFQNYTGFNNDHPVAVSDSRVTLNKWYHVVAIMVFPNKSAIYM